MQFAHLLPDLSLGLWIVAAVPLDQIHLKDVGDLVQGAERGEAAGSPRN